MLNLGLKLFRSFMSVKDINGRLGKNMLTSKTFWAIIFMDIMVNVAAYFDFIVTSGEAGHFLAVTAIIMRGFTNEPAGFINE